MDESREIDWSTAVVKDGVLTVELTGKPSRDWAEHMEAVLTRLAPGRWAPIEVKKSRIEVGSIPEGSVEELRHLLESAALQTNADLLAPTPTDQDAVAREGSADQALTDAFRAFGSAREE